MRQGTLRMDGDENLKFILYGLTFLIFMNQSVGIVLTLVNYRIFITRNYFSGERCGPFGTLVQ